MRPIIQAMRAPEGKGAGTHEGPERLPGLPESEQTEEQRRVVAAIVGGKRGSLRGPFPAMLRSPVVAERFAVLGEYLRFDSSIPKDLNELAILITAREWTAQYEWYAHHRLAMQAGLPAAIAQAVAERRRPDNMTEDQRIVWEFCTELYREHGVSDATYAQTKARFGERGVVDLIGVCGYYVGVSMVLNVSRVPLPADAVPLKP